MIKLRAVHYMRDERTGRVHHCTALDDGTVVFRCRTTKSGTHLGTDETLRGMEAREDFCHKCLDLG